MIKTELHSLYSCRSRRCTRMSVLCSYHIFSMHIIDAAAVVVVMKFISYAAALMHGYVCSLLSPVGCFSRFVVSLTFTVVVYAIGWYG